MKSRHQAHPFHRGIAVDGAVALVAFALTLLLLAGRGDADRGLDALGAALAALACLPLVARSRSPLGVFSLTAAASATLNALGYAMGPPFGPTVALFYVATDERTRARIVETASVVLALFALHVGGTAIGSGGSRRPRSARASPATCTTRPRTRST